MDNYMTNPHPEKQQQFLIAQLKLAIEFDLPVILHSRKTHDNLSAILRRYSVPRKGVIHGFPAVCNKQNVLFNKAISLG